MSEASESYLRRTISISPELELSIMKFAREERIMQNVTTLDGETGKRVTIEIPNVSEAIRIITERFFADRLLEKARTVSAEVGR